MKEKIIKHFTWTDWVSIGEQLDSYKKRRYEVFRSTNGNGLNRYKKVLIVSASCHYSEARVLPLTLYQMFKQRYEEKK